MKVAILADGVERHGQGCLCGDCRSDGTSCRVSIVKIPAFLTYIEKEWVDDLSTEPLLKQMTAPNQLDAVNKAVGYCRSHRWQWVILN